MIFFFIKSVQIGKIYTIILQGFQNIENLFLLISKIDVSCETYIQFFRFVPTKKSTIHQLFDAFHALPG